MMQQYRAARAQIPEQAVLMFRMGDFYEMFFEDARIAAKELDIVLTSRDKNKDPIPMAGVPHHAVRGYIARLVEKGYTVALCDQVEDPKQTKGIVKREITQLVTPGTLSDPEVLDPHSNAYLGYVVPDSAGTGTLMAVADLLSGALHWGRYPTEVVSHEVFRLGIRELLVENGCDAIDWPDGTVVRHVAADTYAPTSAVQVSSDTVATSTLGKLVAYAEDTQRQSLTRWLVPTEIVSKETMRLDATTCRNLELLQTARLGERKGSLWWHLNRCRTAMGVRKLRHWILFPLYNAKPIEKRLDIVGALVAHVDVRRAIRECLKDIRDLERLSGRVALGRVSPHELGLLRTSLEAIARIPAHVQQCPDASALWEDADCLMDVFEKLSCALVDEPPSTSSDGGIFRASFDAELAEAIHLAEDGQDILRKLEERERTSTGINTLKVRYNRVFGYYIEVSRAHSAAVPSHYERKQTLVNAERYITPELKEFEVKVLSARERRIRLEKEHYRELVDALGEQVGRMRRLAHLVAETDVYCSLAEVASVEGYVRPQLSDAKTMTLQGCRHPVVEKFLADGERFVPCDLHLDEERRVMLLTGPNMAGKSTVMREVALTALMAQMGSYVAASSAEVGLVDQIFTRVGSGDDISRGQSTFMVEMTETAEILRSASDRSLVLLDEIGRGTSTFDGLSLAWAVAEFIHDHVGARTVFATHYHELTDLAGDKAGVFNCNVAAKEHNEQVVFLRELREGPASHSYGIQVARLAGVPDLVLARAKEVLTQLETTDLDPFGRHRWERNADVAQMSLFGAPASEPAMPASDWLHDALSDLETDSMTPLQALQTLSAWRDRQKD